MKSSTEAPAVLGPVQRQVRRAAEAWRSWRSRRYWTAERQLENLRNLVQGDHRWLSHDKTADALTTRYLAALAPDWMSRAHACPDHFRREIGLEPQHAFRVADPAEAMVRHLPPPWKFLWDKHGPRVVSSDGRIVASLSSGTINGAYDPAAVMALGKAISGLINDA